MDAAVVSIQWGEGTGGGHGAKYQGAAMPNIARNFFGGTTTTFRALALISLFAPAAFLQGWLQVIIDHWDIYIPKFWALFGLDLTVREANAVAFLGLLMPLFVHQAAKGKSTKEVAPSLMALFVVGFFMYILVFGSPLGCVTNEQSNELSQKYWSYFAVATAVSIAGFILAEVLKWRIVALLSAPVLGISLPLTILMIAANTFGAESLDWGRLDGTQKCVGDWMLQYSPWLLGSYVIILLGFAAFLATRSTLYLLGAATTILLFNYATRFFTWLPEPPMP